MNKTFLRLMVPAAALVLSVTGCKKEDTDTPTQPEPKGPTEVFNYSDAWGLLAAVNTVTTQSVPNPFGGGSTEYEVELGTAVAAFNESAGSSTYVDAGTITCDGETLTKQSNNSYVYQPSGTNTTGIDFSGSSTWNVSGSTNVAAISNYVFSPFPSTPKITSEGPVTLSSGFTVTLQNSVSGADSILFILASGSGYVEKRTGGNVSSCTFTADELSTLSASQYGLIQVSPYQYRREANNGKPLYYINQVTVSDFAEFK